MGFDSGDKNTLELVSGGRYRTFEYTKNPLNSKL